MVQREKVAADELLVEVLDRLFDLCHELHRHVGTAAARHDLTAQQAMVVRSLGEPRSMRSVAEDLSCDPSNVTGLIDRIERLGLVVRSADPDDRRVRRLALTPAGQTVRRRLDRDLAGALSPLAPLGAAELDQLVAVLRRLTEVHEAATMKAEP